MGHQYVNTFGIDIIKANYSLKMTYRCTTKILKDINVKENVPKNLTRKTIRNCITRKDIECYVEIRSLDFSKTKCNLISLKVRSLLHK